jgi:serine/threonine protein kinase
LASNYDIAFLRVLMQQSLADKAQALRCIQVIDEQAQRGQAVTALQVVVRLGLVDANQAERVDGATREELQRLGAPGQNVATTSFRGRIMDSAALQSGASARLPGMPGPPPPMPGQAPSGQFARPPAQQSGANLQGTLAPGYLVQRPAVATPPSGVAASAPPPRPASAPPAKPAPITAPGSARASGFGNGVLTGEETMAGADLERPPSASGAADDGYYDLAENGQGLDGFASGPKVGRGPVGTSYQGRRKADGAPVVVKVLSRRFSQHPDLLAQVLEDVGAWSGFRHPNLASALAVGISNERHVIVFEQARGVTLEAHLHDHGRLEPRAALRVIYDLAQVLAAAQERGLAHGDVRAAKVHFDGQRGMLADPGLARASCLAAGLGQHGLCFGHPTYLAPEVLQERLERPTAATDVYALGTLFYELVCGVPPFQGEVVDVLGKHFDAPLPPPPQGVTFSGAIAGLMLRMTAKGPSHRLPDARAVVTSITNLLEGKPLGPMPGAKPAQKPHPAGISQDEWGKSARKDDYKGTSNNWTVSKIEQAPIVGPTDLGEVGPLTSEVSTSGLRGAASTTGRHSRDMVDEVAAIAQAPGGPRVGEKLGRGTVGTTYEGGLPGHQGPVVVKVVSKKFGKHPELVRRIMEGTRASIGMNHPGIVRAVKALQVAGRDMIVFERAPGRTLREALKAGPLPWRQATSVIMDLARALEAARRVGASHGDVRPEKIFIDDAGKARLADFGLAEAAALGAGFGAAGVAFGHPAYLAPEVVQERKREPDERSDVYALGILFYELLCGKPPFTSSEPKRLLVMHLEATIPPPPDTITVPAAVAELILRMTTKDPTRRPASFGDLLGRLEQAADSSSRDLGDVPDLAVPQSASSDRSSSGLFGISSEGRVSGEGPLGYKSADDDVVSPDAWGEQSLDLSKPSGEWTKSKIAQAPKVGPEEWTPEASGEPDEQSEPQRKLAAVAPPGAKGAAKPGPFLATAQIGKADLAAAIAQAAATKESTPEGAAATDPRSTSKKQARQGATSVRAGKAAGPTAGKEGGSKKQLYLAVGGIVLVLVVMGAFLLGGGGGPKPPPRNTETTSTPPPPVVPPEDPAIKQREELLKRLEVEVKRAEEDVEEDLRSQRFNAANERVRNLSAEARAEPAYQTRISALETKIQQGARERLTAVIAEIDRLVQQHEFQAAQSAAQGVAAWAPDRKTVDQALARVKEQIQAYHRPVAELALPDAIDPAAIEGQLQERLQGWRPDGLLFAKGGVAVEWRDPALLLEDLQVVRGKAPVVEAMPDGKNALHITAAKDAPTFVVVKLPMKRLVDATLDFVMTREAGPSGQVALLMGARPPQPRGFGVSWGVVPVEVKSASDLGNRRTMQAPVLPIHKGLRVRLSTTADTRSLQGTLWVDGQVQPVGPAVVTELSTTAGHLGLWVVDAEVWITGLEVRGLVDPAGLSR